jgi:hypothetical protein
MNASVFTKDLRPSRKESPVSFAPGLLDTAPSVRTSGWRSGFDQSGIGREVGRDGVRPFLETEAVILEGALNRYSDPGPWRCEDVRPPLVLDGQRM